MVGVEFHLDGFDRLAERLDQLAFELDGPVLEKMVRAGARVFKDELVLRTPELSEERSAKSDALPRGAIRDDIGVRTTRDLGVFRAFVGPGKNTRYVARWVEYGHRLIKGGWSKLNGDGLAKGPGRFIKDIPPHPFIRPAYEAARKEAESSMIAVLNKAVNNG